MATRTSNGSDTDTQTQINASATGDIVVIPNGSFTWTTGITCATGIKIMGASIGGVTITSQSNSALVSLDPPASSAQVLEFCNLVFVCGGSVTGASGHFVFVNFASFPVTNGPVAIHDCSFSTPGTQEVLNSMLLISQNGTVVYNCHFNTNATMDPNTGQGSAGDECIQYKNPSTDVWEHPDTMGMTPDAATGNVGDPNGTQNTYVEDCTFANNLTETMDFDDGSRSAVRHCTFTLAATASHGYDTSPFGGRHWELYNNNFIGDSGTTNLPNGWITMRSGTGVIANNTFGDISGSNWGTKSDIAWLSDGACQAKAGHCFTTYPIPRAPGQGWSGGSGSYSYPQASSLGSGYITDPIYVFGNTTGTGNNLWTWNGSCDCANQLALGFNSENYIIQNTDFFIGTAKPNWTAFTYPHPLRAILAGSGGTQFFPTAHASSVSKGAVTVRSPRILPTAKSSSSGHAAVHGSLRTGGYARSTGSVNISSQTSSHPGAKGSSSSVGKQSARTIFRSARSGSSGAVMTGNNAKQIQRKQISGSSVSSSNILYVVCQHLAAKSVASGSGHAEVSTLIPSQAKGTAASRSSVTDRGIARPMATGACNGSGLAFVQGTVFRGTFNGNVIGFGTATHAAFRRVVIGLTHSSGITDVVGFGLESKTNGTTAGSSSIIVRSVERFPIVSMSNGNAVNIIRFSCRPQPAAIGKSQVFTSVSGSIREVSPFGASHGTGIVTARPVERTTVSATSVGTATEGVKALYRYGILAIVSSQGFTRLSGFFREISITAASAGSGSVPVKCVLRVMITANAISAVSNILEHVYRRLSSVIAMAQGVVRVSGVLNKALYSGTSVSTSSIFPRLILRNSIIATSALSSVWIPRLLCRPRPISRALSLGTISQRSQQRITLTGGAITISMVTNPPAIARFSAQAFSGSECAVLFTGYPTAQPSSDWSVGGIAGVRKLSGFKQVIRQDLPTPETGRLASPVGVQQLPSPEE